MLPPLYQVMEVEGMQLTPGRGATGYSGVFQQGSRFRASLQFARKEVSGRVRLGWYSTAVETAVAVARHRLQHGVPTHWKRKSGARLQQAEDGVPKRKSGARLQQAEDGVPKRKPKRKPKQRKPKRKSGALHASDASDMTDEQAVDQPLPCEGSDTESPSDDENEDVLMDVLPPLSQEMFDLLCG